MNCNLITILKALSILAIVSFHTFPRYDNILLWPAYSALFIFFFLSGLMRNQNDSLRRRIEKTTTRLLIPYLIGAAIMHLLGWDFNIFLPAGSYLWFFWALVIYELLMLTVGVNLIFIVSFIILLLIGNWHLLIFSCPYMLGVWSQDYKKTFTSMRLDNKIIHWVGGNTRLIYLFHFPLLVFLRW